MLVHQNRDVDDEFFLAGEKVRPGKYCQVGGGRQVILEKEDFLPASLDGTVACYARMHETWGQMSRQAVVER
jgi:hypothetical protein